MNTLSPHITKEELVEIINELIEKANKEEKKNDSKNMDKR